MEMALCATASQKQCGAQPVDQALLVPSSGTLVAIYPARSEARANRPVVCRVGVIRIVCRKRYCLNCWHQKITPLAVRYAATPMRRWLEFRMFARWPDEFIHAWTASLLCGWPIAMFSATGRRV